MTRAIIWERLSEPVPEPGPQVRFDLAWTLFWGWWEPGTLPAQNPRMLSLMSRWFWEYMGQMTGHLRPQSPDTIWLITPPLDPGAREYVTRLASFWCDEVYGEYPVNPSRNQWTAPAVDLHHLPDTALWADMSDTLQGVQHYLLPMLGVGRVFIKVQEVAAGTASARLHSHTGQDEYYLVLKGSGTLRMGPHERPVTGGTFIAKPTGPDLTSHILADRGEPVTILDLEVYPDPRLSFGTKDTMVYPDHQELVMVGPGWEGMVPQATLGPTDDVFDHYFAGYVRAADGTVSPRSFPGHPPRSEQDGHQGESGDGE
ncbi:MAG: cupin domain-containing protein [Clostridia bacterium]